MNLKKILTKRRVVAGLLIGLYLFAWAHSGLANTNSNYDIKEFRCEAKRKVGEEDKVKVKIQNYGSSDPGAILSAFGMQEGTVILLTPEEGLEIDAEPGGEDEEYTFIYYPTSSGKITWQVSIDGGEPLLCTTVVSGDESTKTSYDIKEFRCDSKGEIGEEDKVKVKIQNYGSSDPGAILSAFGMQEGTEILLTEGGLKVFDEPGGGDLEVIFEYYPTSSGKIIWEASVGGEEPLYCTTIVAGDEPPTQTSGYDIKEFRCDSERDVGEETKVRVKIENFGSTDPGAILSAFGMQGETEIFLAEEGFAVHAEPGGGDEEYIFKYYPTSSGVITWQASVDGKEPLFCTTTVIGDDGGGTTPPNGNFIAFHNSSSPQYKKNCTECHSDVLTGQSLDPSIPTAHRAMLPNTPGKLGDNIQCRWCHRTVDLAQGSAGNLGKNVDVTLCALCHGPFGPSTQFYQAGIAPDNPDGAFLYDLVCAACHRDLANSEVGGESAEEIQEEIDKNSGGMGPLDVLAPEEIQAIANVLSQIAESDDESDD